MINICILWTGKQLSLKRKKCRSEGFFPPRWTFKITSIKVFWDKLQATSTLQFFNLPHAAESLADGEFAMDLMQSQEVTQRTVPVSLFCSARKQSPRLQWNTSCCALNSSIVVNCLLLKQAI